MKKFLFFIFFAPSILNASCSTFTYTLSERMAGYDGTRYYVCDTLADKPYAGLVMGEKVYVKNTGLVYIATNTTGVAYQANMSTGMSNLQSISWADGTVQISSPPITSFDPGIIYSSNSVSYLGISSSPVDSLIKSSASLSYLGISSLTVSNGILILSSASLSYTAISTDALKITYSSSAVSYLGISSASVDSLIKSSASVSYFGISSVTASNNILTLSSAALSYTAISTDALKITYSSSAISYLGISSASVDSLTKSSASLSYVGISSLTIANSVLSPSSASVSYIGISSGAVVLDNITLSSAAVSYLGKSSSTLTELTRSSASVSYVGISSAVLIVTTQTITGPKTWSDFSMFAGSMTVSTGSVKVMESSSFTLSGPYTGSLARGVSTYFTTASSSTWVYSKTPVPQGNGALRIFVATENFSTDTDGIFNGSVNSDWSQIRQTTSTVDVLFQSLNQIGAAGPFVFYSFGPSAFTLNSGRGLTQWSSNNLRANNFSTSNSQTGTNLYTWPLSGAGTNGNPLTATTAGQMSWSSTIVVSTISSSFFNAATTTVSDITFSSSTVFNSTYTAVLSTTANNYNPGYTPVAFATATGGADTLNITGFTNSEAGKNFYIYNVSTKQISFTHLSTFSSVGNRIALTTSTTPVYISSGGCMWFMRDNQNKLWRGSTQ